MLLSPVNIARHPRCSMMVWVLCLVVCIIKIGSASAATVQDLDQIKTAVQTFVVDQSYGAYEPEAVKVGYLDYRLRLANCETGLHTFFASGSPRIGNVTVGVQCDSANPWRVYVPVKIQVLRKVVVATRTLSRHTQIRHDHVKLAHRDVSTLAAGYYERASQVIGQLLKQPIIEGGIITPQSITKRHLIKRGDKVTIVASLTGMQVRMTGKALSNGAQGERVRVENTRSGRIVEGEVTKAGMVRVLL